MNLQILKYYVKPKSVAIKGIFVLDRIHENFPLLEFVLWKLPCVCESKRYFSAHDEKIA
jgi:hypothetical protein